MHIIGYLSVFICSICMINLVSLAFVRSTLTPAQSASCNCPNLIQPVCSNDITFQHRCIAQCQGFSNLRDAACEGDDLLREVPWSGRTDRADAPSKTTVSAGSLGELQVKLSNRQARLSSSSSSSSDSSDSGNGNYGGSDSSVRSSRMPPPAAPEPVQSMGRFNDEGFTFVGSLQLSNDPPDEWTPDMLPRRMGASSQDQKGYTGASGANQLQVRALRYSVADGNFYVESSPRPASLGPATRKESHRRSLHVNEISRNTHTPAGAVGTSAAARGGGKGATASSSSSSAAAAGKERPASGLITEEDGGSIGGTGGALRDKTDGSADLRTMAAGHEEVKEYLRTVSTSNRRANVNRRMAEKPVRRSLVGGDPWRAQQSSSVYPFSALAYIRFPFRNLTTRCTGTFISPYDVLTAAHCVWNFEQNTGFSDWTIYPGLDTRPWTVPFMLPDYVTFYRTENASVSTSPGKVYSASSQRYPVNYFDIAVIRVLTPHTSWVGMKYDCARISYSKTLACGYPIIDGTEFAPLCVQCFLPASQCRPMWMIYNYCHSAPGGSGMGIMDLTDFRVVGVLSGGERYDYAYSYWTPIDAFHFNNLIQWIVRPSPPPPPPLQASLYRQPPPRSGQPPPPGTISINSTQSPPIRRPPPPVPSPGRNILSPSLRSSNGRRSESFPLAPEQDYRSIDESPPAPVVRSPPTAPAPPDGEPVGSHDLEIPANTTDEGSMENSEEIRSGVENTSYTFPTTSSPTMTPTPSNRVSGATTQMVNGVQLTAQATDTCRNGTLRLADGPNSWSGRVEICANGVWGTICDLGWGWDDARVACRQLGFPAGGEAISGGWFPSAAASMPIYMGNLTCLGFETSLMDCFQPGPAGNCTHPFDAGVICTNPTVASPPPAWGFTNGSNTWQPVDYPCSQEGMLRLVPSYGTIMTSNRSTPAVGLGRGRVEVCSSGQWGSVCDDAWDNNDAAVVCRQMKFTGGWALTRTTKTAAPQSPPNSSFLAASLTLLSPGPLNMSIWLSNVDCSGTESSLLACRRRSALGQAACTHQEDAGVVCFSSAAPAAPPQPPPPECSEDGALRLVPLPGQPQGTGRLEVCYDGRYGLVCDTNFGVSEARVACRQLNYLYGRPMGPSNSGVAGDPGPGAFFWMEDVKCSIAGSDGGSWFWRLTQCTFSDWGGSRCTPQRQAVGLVCSNDAAVIAPSPPSPPPSSSPYRCSTPGSIRVNGGNSSFGRLEVCSSSNAWGTVCDSGWGNTDAAVACRELGFTSGAAAAPGSFPVGSGDQALVLSDVACTGSEPRLWSCSSRSAAAAGCSDHRRDVGLACSNPTQPNRLNVTCSEIGALRIVSSSGAVQTSLPAVGRVEVCYNNEWGALCNLYEDAPNSWDDINAAVVCTQLNGGVTVSEALPLSPADSRVPPLPAAMRFWRYNVLCDPGQSIMQCTGSGWGFLSGAGASCTPMNVAGVACR